MYSGGTGGLWQQILPPMDADSNLYHNPQSNMATTTILWLQRRRDKTTLLESAATLGRPKRRGSNPAVEPSNVPLSRFICVVFAVIGTDSRQMYCRIIYFFCQKCDNSGFWYKSKPSPVLQSGLIPSPNSSPTSLPSLPLCLLHIADGAMQPLKGLPCLLCSFLSAASLDAVRHGIV